MSDLLVYIDSPCGCLISTPISTVVGWFNHDERDPDQEPELRIVAQTSKGARPLRSTIYKRQDLDARYGTGFTAYLDLHSLCDASDDVSEFCLVFECEGKRCLSESFCISDSVRGEVSLSAKNKLLKDGLIRSLLSETADLVEGVDDRFCAWKYMRGGFKDFLFRLEDKKDPISSFPYSGSVLDFVNSFSSGEVVLDVGCGLRQSHLPNVINCEIYDYPSTDLICDGAFLPFRDESIDGVLSLAVLEHVSNPFVYASELKRVLKPGGRLMLKVPFLQAEHGYPYHFFNPTRQGAVELFKGLDVLGQSLDGADHPINTLNQVLSIYHSGLPVENQQSFLDLKIKDIFRLADPLVEFEDRSRFLNFDDPVTPWLIAWGTTTLFKKPQN